MEISQEVRENFIRAARQFAEAIKNFVREIVERVWDFVKLNLPAIEKFVQGVEKEKVRQRNNKLARSSWIVKRDTRKPSQVFDKRPVHAIRKIIN